VTRWLRNRRFIFGMAVSLLAVAFAVRGVEFAGLASALADADYVWLIPATLAILVGQLLRSIRWQALFGDGPRPDLRNSFEILSIGYMVSAIAPARLGDPVRAWLVDVHTPAGGAEALATVLAERAIDFLTIAALLALWVPQQASGLLTDQMGPGVWSTPANLSILALALVLGVYAGMIAVSYFGGVADRTTTQVLVRVGISESLSGRIGRFVGGFAEGFAPLRSLKTAALVTTWTVAVWLIGALVYWLVLQAFDLQLPFSAAVFALGATALFAVLPSSPGYVGVFHTAIVLSLGMFSGVPKETALAYAIVLHALTIVILIVLGVVSLWLLGLSGSDLGQRLRGEEFSPQA